MSEGRFRVLFDNAADPHFVLAGGVIVDCNAATWAALGLRSRAEVLQVEPAALSPDRQPDGRGSAEKSAEMNALAFSRGVHRFEWIHRRLDGSTFPVQVTLNAIDWNGEPALIAVWHDLTEARAREQALQNANHRLADAHAALAEAHKTLTGELEAVGRIQRSLLPRRLPTIPTLQLAADYQTSARAGGDYYDLFDLGGGRWGIFVADVSGHGTPAAVIMAVTHALAHGYPGPPNPPGLLLSHLNSALWQGYTSCEQGAGVAFVTAFYGVYDAHTRTLTHARAGHPPPRLCRAGHVRDLGGEGGLPLGICDDAASFINLGGTLDDLDPTSADPYPQTTTQLVEGDRLLLYTDGVTEARSPDGTFFGEDRLDNILAASGTAQSPAQLIEAIKEALQAFSPQAGPTDDQTLVGAIVK